MSRFIQSRVLHLDTDARSDYHYGSPSMIGATMRHRTFGRLTGLRVSEYALGAGNFGTRWGMGARARRGAADLRPLRRGGRDADRHRRELPARRVRDDPRRTSSRAIATTSSLATKFSNGYRQAGRHHDRQRPQEHDQGGRGQLEAAQDRPDRPLLGAPPGRRDADRGDPARARRSRLERQDPPRGPVELPRLAGRAGADDRGAARLVADRRASRSSTASSSAPPTASCSRWPRRSGSA